MGTFKNKTVFLCFGFLMILALDLEYFGSPCTLSRSPFVPLSENWAPFWSPFYLETVLFSFGCSHV